MSSSPLPSTEATPVEPSNMSSSQNDDYLTSLPTEILAKMISELPISNYLDITHTCRRLRSVLKVNAGMICNLAIRSRHRVRADFLESEMMSGWLVPAHQAIREQEEDYYRRTKYNLENNCAQQYDHDEVKYFSLLGQLVLDENEVEDHLIHIKMSRPGPQYLYLLDASDKCRGNNSKDVYGELEYLYHWTSLFFWEFMDEFNNQYFRLKDGTLEMAGIGGAWAAKFPRELVWYYGVDKLVLYEKREQELAKKKVGEKTDKIVDQTS